MMMSHKVIRRGGRVTLNGKLVFDFRKETSYTVSEAAERIVKRLTKILLTK